jgi:hypothetical protein
MNEALLNNKAGLWNSTDSWLNNKAGLWNSTDSWKLEFIGTSAYLKNTSKNKFFAIDNSFNVTLQDLGQNNTNKLWKQGRIDNEGYFTLSDPFSPKVLTATKYGKLIVMERKKNVIDIRCKISLSYFAFYSFRYSRY